MSLYSLIMIENMGLDLFPKVFGATCLTMGFVFVSTGPLIGKNT